MEAQAVIDELTERYPLPYRTFGCDDEQYGTNEWRRRRLIANIIVGGSRDIQAVRATTELFSLYTFEYLANRKNYDELRREIADMLEDEFEIQYAGKKAEYILNTCYDLVARFGGIVPDNMEDLTSLPGVGRHAASVVLGLAFDKQTFGVDLHVRRIVKRMGLVDRKTSDKKIEQAFAQVSNSAHASRALMEFGNHICRYRPSCGKCPFNNTGCDKTILK